MDGAPDRVGNSLLWPPRIQTWGKGEMRGSQKGGGDADADDDVDVDVDVDVDAKRQGSLYIWKRVPYGILGTLRSTG